MAEVPGPVPGQSPAVSQGFGEKPTTEADALQARVDSLRAAEAQNAVAGSPTGNEPYPGGKGNEGLGVIPTNEASGLPLHEGPAQWPRGVQGPEQPPWTSHTYWPPQYETGSSPEERAQAANRGVMELIQKKADSDPSSAFFKRLRETFQRVEAGAKLTPTDKDALLVGSREFAKDAAGVEDTSDMSPEAQRFQLAQMDYLRWLLDKIR